jgi:hypothetical protein
LHIPGRQGDRGIPKNDMEKKRRELFIVVFPEKMQTCVPF